MRRSTICAVIASVLFASIASQVIQVTATFDVTKESTYPNSNADAICKSLQITKDTTRCKSPKNSCAICKQCTKGDAFWMTDLELQQRYDNGTSYEKRVWARFCNSNIFSFAATVIAVSMLAAIF